MEMKTRYANYPLRDGIFFFLLTIVVVIVAILLFRLMVMRWENYGWHILTNRWNRSTLVDEPQIPFSNPFEDFFLLYVCSINVIYTVLGKIWIICEIRVTKTTTKKYVFLDAVITGRRWNAQPATYYLLCFIQEKKKSW